MPLFPFPAPRLPTAGERALIEPLFGGVIDCNRLRIYRRRYLPFQAAATAMAPNGALYFPQPKRGGGLYCADFSQQRPAMQALFVHECVHVWQHRLGYPVRLAGLLLALSGGYRGRAAYRYRHLLNENRRFCQFNMEQQADMVADYFLAERHGRGAPPELRRLLAPFLANPADRSLLPALPRLRAKGF